MNTRQQLLFAQVLSVALPLGLVLAARIMLSPAPVAASPVEDVAPPTATGVAAPPASPPSPAQLKALDWLDASAAEFTRSPMDHPSPMPPSPAAPRDTITSSAPAAPGVPDESNTHGLRVTSIIGDDDGGMATINGKIYKIGETVGEGITLVRVEPRLNRAVFSRADGSTFVIDRTDQPRRPATPRPSRSSTTVIPPHSHTAR